MYYYQGDAVEVKGWGTGFVEKITRGATPYHVRLTEGSRSGDVVRCADRHMTPVTDADAKERVRRAQLAYLRDQADASQELVVGVVVKVDSAKYNPEGAPYVVIGGVRDGRVKVAKLGGDRGRYLTMPVERVSRVAHLDVTTV